MIYLYQFVDDLSLGRVIPIVSTYAPNNYVSSVHSDDIKKAQSPKHDKRDRERKTKFLLIPTLFKQKSAKPSLYCPPPRQQKKGQNKNNSLYIHLPEPKP